MTLRLRTKVLFFWLASILLALSLVGGLFLVLLEQYRERVAHSRLDEGLGVLELRLQALAETGQALAEHFARRTETVARLNLISRYQNPEAYQALVFNPEKQALARQLRQHGEGHGTALLFVTDTQGEIAAFSLRENGSGVILGLTSWDEAGTRHLLISQDGEVWQHGAAPPVLHAVPQVVAQPIPEADAGGRFFSLSGNPALVSLAPVLRSRVDGSVQAVGTMGVALFFDTAFLTDITALTGNQLSLHATGSLNASLPDPLRRLLVGGTALERHLFFSTAGEAAAWMGISRPLEDDPLGERLWFVLSRPLSGDTAEVMVFGTAFLVVLVVVGGIMLPLAWFLERRTLSLPILTLKQAVESLRSGGYVGAVNYKARDELGDLARAFDGMAVILRDRESRLREAQAALEEQLVQRNALIDQLSLSNEEMARLAEVSAHHLQEPSRRLVSFAQLLRKTLAEEVRDPEGVEFYLSTIESQALYLRNLVQDIQTYLTANQSPGLVKRTDPNPVLAKVRDSLGPLLLEGHAGEILTTPLPPVMISPGQLHEIFRILLLNALQHRDPTRPVRIEVSGHHEDVGGHPQGVIRVADNGPGIAPEYRERVFRLFERLASKDVHPGTGIGLPVVRRIVESLGGKAWIEETPGGGVTVAFTLPIPPEQC